MVDEIRYIFKLRIGCDGSRETLLIRKLIITTELNCHRCGTPETRQHIIQECGIYNQLRTKLVRELNRTEEFRKTTEELELWQVCLYSTEFQR